MESGNGKPKNPYGLSLDQLGKLDDQDLIAHLKAGHHNALAVLFNRHHRLVLAVAFKILRDPAEAEDMMQSVFLEVHRRSDQFEASKGSAKVWLLQYAYHRSMNRREYLNVRGFYSRDQLERPQASSAGHEGQLHRLSLPEARCMAREAMESLNDSQRSVLHMAYFEDMPLKDIALSTGESFGNVRHHYYRALQRLRSLFLQQSPGRSQGPTTEEQSEIELRETDDVET